MSLQLLPVPVAVARAVCAGGDVAAALARHGLVPAPDWPHVDTPDALRPLAEHTEHVGEDPGTFLVACGDTVVGDCGWFGPPGAAGSVEIGYGLSPSVRGRGLGSEAVRLLLDWVGARPDVTEVRAEVLPGNTASLALLARLGFTVDGNLSGHLQLSLPLLREVGSTWAGGQPPG